MDAEERKMALLIAAFDQERERTAQATNDLRQVIEGADQQVEKATRAAVAKGLEALRGETELAARAMQQLRQLTLWQSAWRHVTTVSVSKSASIE